MKNAIKKIKANLWPRFSHRLPGTCRLSYSQFGEDMVLSWLFRHRQIPGYYVDIGAFHPIFLSNTYALYCAGWRGVCVEPREHVAQEFRIFRPQDTIISAAVTDGEVDHVEFFTFAEPTLNTTDAEQARAVQDRGIPLVSRASVPAVTLTTLFDKYLSPDRQLDLLTIDVEGLDEAILRSNDWDRFRPTVLVFEAAGIPFEEVSGLSIVRELGAVGYEIVSKCGESVIARHRKQWDASNRSNR